MFSEYYSLDKIYNSNYIVLYHLQKLLEVTELKLQCIFYIPNVTVSQLITLLSEGLSQVHKSVLLGPVLSVLLSSHIFTSYFSKILYFSNKVRFTVFTREALRAMWNLPLYTDRQTPDALYCCAAGGSTFLYNFHTIPEEQTWIFSLLREFCCKHLTLLYFKKMFFHSPCSDPSRRSNKVMSTHFKTTVICLLPNFPGVLNRKTTLFWPDAEWMNIVLFGHY
jgi:hypothetical protein